MCFGWDLVYDQRRLLPGTPSRGRVLGCFDSEDEIPDIDPVAVADDRGLLNATAVDISTIGTVEVRYDKPAISEEELCVLLRHVPLGKQQIVALYSANT